MGLSIARLKCMQHSIFVFAEYTCSFFFAETKQKKTPDFHSREIWHCLNEKENVSNYVTMQEQEVRLVSVFCHQSESQTDEKRSNKHTALWFGSRLLDQQPQIFDFACITHLQTFCSTVCLKFQNPSYLWSRYLVGLLIVGHDSF